MNLTKPIGGYFELELRRGRFPYADAVLLNTGRNCFEYILRAQSPTKVYMPKYTCDVMLEPLEKLNIPYDWYEIDERLELTQNLHLGDGEFLLYTNYFGVKNNYSLRLSKLYKEKLILDCSQAFYFKPLKEGHTFYSPRKFFGLPDGGCVFTDKQLTQEFMVDVSYGRVRHLLKRLDLGAEEGYEDFKSNDDALTGEPIKQMSKLTKSLLNNIDYERAAKIRLDNFTYLNNRLDSSNNYKVDDISTGPLAYPYLVKKGEELRKRLIDNKVFVATYWPNVLEWFEKSDIEYVLARDLLPIPIDQRYDQSDMQTIVDVIMDYA